MLELSMGWVGMDRDARFKIIRISMFARRLISLPRIHRNTVLVAASDLPFAL